MNIIIGIELRAPFLATKTDLYLWGHGRLGCSFTSMLCETWTFTLHGGSINDTDGTRTHNLRFRRPTPYPLGHGAQVSAHAWCCEIHKHSCYTAVIVSTKWPVCMEDEDLSVMFEHNGLSRWVRVLEPRLRPWGRYFLPLEESCQAWFFGRKYCWFWSLLGRMLGCTPLSRQVQDSCTHRSPAGVPVDGET